jgi:hypothetical protein
LTKNGISGNTTNLDALFTINASATGANTAPFTNGVWIRNL